MGLGVNSGGMSKGGPIWPGGKSSPSQPLKGAEEAFELHKEVSAPGIKSAGGSTPVKETSPQVQTQKTQETTLPTKVSQLSPKDIFQQLANINVPINSNNQQLALLMAAHGIEISEESFGLVNKLLKGKKGIQTKKNLDSDRASNAYSFVGNLKRPFDTIQWLCSKTQSSKDGYGFLFLKL